MKKLPIGEGFLPMHKQEILPIIASESFKKVEGFFRKKDLKIGRITILENGACFIVERLDKNGEQEEVYLFNNKGDLIKYEDLKSIRKIQKESAEEIYGNLLDMLMTDNNFTKEINQ